MIALKLAFQSLASVGAVIGIAGGGYYAYNLPDDFFLLVTAAQNTTDNLSIDLFVDKITETKDLPASQAAWVKTEAFVNTTGSGGAQAPVTPTVPAAPAQPAVVTPTEVATTEENKQYKCKSIASTKESASSCDIYSLTFDQTKKTLFSSSIQEQIKKQDSLTKVKAKSELVEKKFFLLKTSSALYKDWKFDGSKTINLASIGTESKSFATLTVHARFDLEEKTGKTNFVITKAPSTIPTINASDASEDATTITYKCKLEDEDKSACEIVKLSESSLTDISFAFISIPATTTKLTFEASSHYLIKWTSESKYSFEDLSSKTITVSEEPAGANASTNDLKFTIEAPVMVLPSTGNTAVEQALIIK